MGNCAKLKWNRKRLGLTQSEFAAKVGVCQYTICKLERDETAWATIRAETEDKIYAAFDNMASWQPERADRVIGEIAEEMKNEEVIDIQEEVKEMYVESEPVVEKREGEVTDELRAVDIKTLTLIEFAYEGLKEASSHSEFVANIGMLRRVLAKYTD